MAKLKTTKMARNKNTIEYGSPRSDFSGVSEDAQDLEAKFTKNITFQTKHQDEEHRIAKRRVLDAIRKGLAMPHLTDLSKKSRAFGSILWKEKITQTTPFEQQKRLAKTRVQVAISQHHAMPNLSDLNGEAQALGDQLWKEKMAISSHLGQGLRLARPRAKKARPNRYAMPHVSDISERTPGFSDKLARDKTAKISPLEQVKILAMDTSDVAPAPPTLDMSSLLFGHYQSDDFIAQGIPLEQEDSLTIDLSYAVPSLPVLDEDSLFDGILWPEKSIAETTYLEQVECASENLGSLDAVVPSNGFNSSILIEDPEFDDTAFLDEKYPSFLPQEQTAYSSVTKVPQNQKNASSTTMGDIGFFKRPRINTNDDVGMNLEPTW